MLKKIVFFHTRSEAIRVFGRAVPAITAIVQIVFDKEASDAINYLKENGAELRFVQGLDHIKDFEIEYSSLIGRINAERAYDKFWWALNLTNKNPITTPLCSKVYYAVLISRLINSFNAEWLVVIDSDREVFCQVERLGADVDIIYAGARSGLKDLTRKISLFSIFYRALLAIAQKIIATLYAPPGKIEKEKERVVIMSLLYGPAFKEGRYQDIYFGSFVEYLKKSGKDILSLVWVFESYPGMLKKARLIGKEYHIYAREYFISTKEIVSALFMSLRKYFTPLEPIGPCMIKDVDVSYLVQHYVRREYTSSRFFGNLLSYFAAKGLSRSVRIERFYYPFENRAFEKMMVLALREYAPSTRIIGYQHASLSSRHTNFFLTKEEAAATPLPDVLLTMGGVTKDILKNRGNFPEKILRSGCALRQSGFSGRLKNKPVKITRLFIALATGIDEYVKALSFLSEALGERPPYEIWIRPHPVFSLDEAIMMAGKPAFAFMKADKQSLEDCFAWADVVLYVHSTISLEAMARGIPVINIGIDEPLDPDPLFDFDDFKWRAGSPGDLLGIIDGISQLDENEFLARQKAGEAYVNRYMKPVTDECLKNFLEC
jgi:hypothetical protein